MPYTSLSPFLARNKCLHAVTGFGVQKKLNYKHKVHDFFIKKLGVPGISESLEFVHPRSMVVTPLGGNYIFYCNDTT